MKILCLLVSYTKKMGKFFFSSWRKESDPELDPDPDPLVRGTDPRIWIGTKMSRIQNNAFKNSSQSPHLTTSEVPKTRSRSHAWKSCLMWVQKLAGMASPNSTTSGRITPPIRPRHHDQKSPTTEKQCCGSMIFGVDPDPDLDPRIHASD